MRNCVPYLGDGLNARRRVGDDAGPVAVGLAVGSAKRGDRLGLRHLMGEHVAERSEFTDLELPIAHRLDLGVVAGRNENLDLAAKLLADQLSDLLIDRD